MIRGIQKIFYIIIVFQLLNPFIVFVILGGVLEHMHSNNPLYLFVYVFISIIYWKCIWKRIRSVFYKLDCECVDIVNMRK